MIEVCGASSPEPVGAAGSTVTIAVESIRPAPPAAGGAASASVTAIRCSSGMPASTDVVGRVGDRTLTLADIDREWQRTDPAGYLALMRQEVIAAANAVSAELGEPGAMKPNAAKPS